MPFSRPSLRYPDPEHLARSPAIQFNPTEGGLHSGDVREGIQHSLHSGSEYVFPSTVPNWDGQSYGSWYVTLMIGSCVFDVLTIAFSGLGMAIWSEPIPYIRLTTATR